MTEKRNVLTSDQGVELATAAKLLACPPWYFPDKEPPDKRLIQATKLIEAGSIVALPDVGMYQITSPSGTVYTLSTSGPCTCKAAQHGQSGVCYHRVAVKLYQEYQRRLPQPFVPRVPLVTEDERTMLTADTKLCAAANCLSSGTHEVDGRFFCIAHVDTPLEEVGQTEAAVPTGGFKAPTPSELFGQSHASLMQEDAVRPALRSIREIIADLSEPLPKEAIAVKKMQGSPISYIHWQTAVRLLDTYAPGWYGQVTRLDHLAGHVVIVYRLTIPCLEGDVWREATGCEVEGHKGYGDVFSNAEAMAFKRAAAKFGVALDLYDKDDTAEALERHLGQGSPVPLSTSEARKRIAELLRQAGVENTKTAYQQAVQAMTGLALEPAHFAEIVRRLEYRCAAPAPSAA